VNRFKEFNIPITGLKEGNYEYKLDIKSEFFTYFENTLVDGGEVKVKILMEKLNNIIILNFEIKGSIQTTCDRCADPLKTKVIGSEKIFVKYGTEAEELAENVLVISHDANEIELAQTIYEMIVLAKPSKNVHAKSADCNQQVIKKLKEYEIKNSESIDPRWAALNKLKNTNLN
jgi:uncharacterized protein